MKRLLILGTSPLALRLIEEIDGRPESGYAVIAVDDGSGDRDRRAVGPPFVGSLDALDQIVEQTRPDGIVVAVPDAHRPLPIRQLLEARVFRGIAIIDAANLHERITGKLAIDLLEGSHLIFANGFRHSRLEEVVRRALSCVVAAVGLLLATPLFGLIAVAIKLNSPGPVFFTQQRTGLRGRPFTLLKFRTMRQVEKPPSEWARDNEDRITRVGRVLRRFWLDELPQLVNILRGDMDLVGPRPHPVSNFELFVLVSRNAPECGEAIPYYTLRCLVRPGLTGWAQVHYRYANDLDEEIEKMRYDLYYIKYRSLWLDLRILFETLRIVLRRRGTRSPARHSAGAQERTQQVSSRTRSWFRPVRPVTALAGDGSAESSQEAWLYPDRGGR